MPFAYYGAKHGLASKYPRPRHPLVIEPFAGSAAYSVHHAATIEHAILIDADERLVEFWHELQQMTVADVDLISRQLYQERFTSPLLAGIAGSGAMRGVLNGKPQTVTPRMHDRWGTTRARIVEVLPFIRHWEVRHGTYADAPDVCATWFIDPPYQENGSMAGAGYRHAASAIDFDYLADWCRSRSGLTIVCEQSPAAWLPFAPFASQLNGAHTSKSNRQEVIWRSDLEQPSLFAS